jgi:SHS2 domain-containing protein
MELCTLHVAFAADAEHTEAVDELMCEPGCRRNGETFDRQKHASGTEVKAITYSAMDVREQGDDIEVFVIVDI